MADPKKTVLFLCVENANRGQMAEAFARTHGSSRKDTEKMPRFCLGPGKGSLHPSSYVARMKAPRARSFHESQGPATD